MNTTQPQDNSINNLTNKEGKQNMNTKENINNLKDYIKSKMAIAETFCVYAILREKDWTKGFHNLEKFLERRGIEIEKSSWEYLIFNEFELLSRKNVLINITEAEKNEFTKKLINALKGVK